jgi:CRISPR-associated protein Cmr3
MSWLFIEPQDVWLFRDGRPFDAGVDHGARSLFPPTPNTVQGIIRSRYLVEQDVDFQEYADRDSALQTVGEAIGWPGDGYGRMRLRGPLVSRWDEGNQTLVRYVPLPADVVKVGNDHRLLRPLKISLTRANWPDNGLLPLWLGSLTDDDVPKEAKGWLSEKTLPDYLADTPSANLSVEHDDALFVREGRFGVGIASRHKRPEEGLLYQVEFIRPRSNVGLAVELNGVALAPSGLLRMGGESRAGRFWTVVPSALPGQTTPGPDADGQTRFRLIFLTPARFEGGWQPQGGDWSAFFDAPVTLKAAALPRARPIGGARVDKHSQRDGNFQKVMRRYVPSGSVYFFESEGAVTPRKSYFTDDDAEGQIGFGLAIFGQWNYERSERKEKE